MQPTFNQLKNIVPKFCDNCGKQHDDADFSMVNQQESNIVFQIACKQCGRVYLVKINPGSPVAIQPVETNNTDVKGDEFSKFAYKPQVRKEEALDVYMLLKNINTLDEFLKLFEDTIAPSPRVSKAKAR